ncbi:hypothetical protein WICANDRAFT_99209 [Wickerhamomyces anomalus NRRL Y-366-8]|uniref:Uncharacterized protein n=1 Tax=Wickerhamomyces anomalus (strain ATCC 58044 / CBS 1984 / NCYC 433 / NRRL Y-366-8) TaxID=683960 RepID=A0A1E3PCE2_WICAA|nr:uncharacterized protein WICANDRAFT_99209 [Wickerhamomyces anomalus NRRL Y-366-8]ODQ62894.1 hypothetical protein WICANDRAFT_99209 [Wickerhamomyces anomalus NRRL Y-366-8]
MDNISNLSSNLPPTKPISEESIKEINQDLVLEFKNAAKSVASLYKLSLQKNSMLRYKGYLDCIDDLLNLIKNDGDVENWALMKKLELEGKLTGSELKKESDKANMSSSPSKQDLLDPQIPMDYDFTMSHPNQHKFPPTMPMLSVDHSNHRVPKDKRLIKTPGTNNNKESPNTDVSDENNSSEDEANIDDSAAKRKLQSMRTDKRVKY